MKTTWKLAVLIGLGALAVSQASANLIVNGDFQAGDTGFNTAYIPNQIGLVENSYSIVNDPLGPAPIQNPYAASYGGIDYYDHTLNNANGLMMAVNGAGNSSLLVWGQTVSGLTIGQTYEFSLWLSSWDNASPAILDVQINNVTQATLNAPATSGVWVNHSFLWTALSTTAAINAIYDNNTVAQGNDFALDDISLVAVPEPTTMIAGALLLLPFGASTLRILRKKRMAGLIGVGALALGLLASGGSAKANLIVNGSFELGGFVPNGDDTMDLPSGSTAMTGWTVTTANLAWIGPSNPFGLSASDGSYFLDLSGYHDNQPYGGVAASTGISTVIGQQYNVAFDVGSDVVYDTVSPSVQVTLNGNPPTGTFTAGPIAGVYNRWETFDFAFTATSANTVITFQGVGADNQKYIGLDNVVVSAVPEPTTMIAGALLLLPFGASTLRMLRKTRTA